MVGSWSFCYILLASYYSSILLFFICLSISSFQLILTLVHIFSPLPSPLSLPSSQTQSCTLRNSHADLCPLNITPSRTKEAKSCPESLSSPLHLLGPIFCSFSTAFWTTVHLMMWEKVIHICSGGSTNLRCPKLRLPARILFGPRAPKVSFRDTRNCSKHSKINVSRLNFFFFNTNVRAGIYFRDVLIHSSHYRWKTEAKRSVWNSNPIQIQDLGMSIISSYNDRIISVTKELGLIGLIYL